MSEVPQDEPPNREDFIFTDLTEEQPKWFLNNAQKIITQQRRAIEKLQKENKDVQLELSGKGGKKPTAAQQKRLDKLSDIRQTLQHKIEVERRQADSLEKELDVAQARVNEQRKQMGGTQGPAHCARQAATHLQVLENRLEKVLQRFSEIISKNRDLRKEIDDVQKERLTMECAFQRIEQSLQARAAELESTREAIDAAVEAQNHMLSKIAALKALEDRELATFKAELQQLQQDRQGQQRLMQAHQVNPEDLFEAGATLEEQEEQSQQILSHLQAITGILNQGHIRDYFQAREERNAAMSVECQKLSDQLIQLAKRKTVLLHEITELENGLGLGIVRDAVKQMNMQTETLCKRTQQLNEKHDETLAKLEVLKCCLIGACKALHVEIHSPDGEQDGEPMDHVPQLSPFYNRSGQKIAADLKLLFNQLEAHARIIVHVHRNHFTPGTGKQEIDAAWIRTSTFALAEPQTVTESDSVPVPSTNVSGRKEQKAGTSSSKAGAIEASNGGTAQAKSTGGDKNAGLAGTELATSFEAAENVTRVASSTSKSFSRNDTTRRRLNTQVSVIRLVDRGSKGATTEGPDECLDTAAKQDNRSVHRASGESGGVTVGLDKEGKAITDLGSKQVGSEGGLQARTLDLLLNGHLGSR